MQFGPEKGRIFVETLHHGRGHSLTYPMLIIALYLSQPEDHQHSQNEVGTQSPASRI